MKDIKYLMDISILYNTMHFFLSKKKYLYRLTGKAHDTLLSEEQASSDCR